MTSSSENVRFLLQVEQACEDSLTSQSGFCEVFNVVIDNTTDFNSLVTYTLNITDYFNETISEEATFNELVLRAEGDTLLNGFVVKASSIVLGACKLFITQP